jgi:transposase
MNSIDYIGFDIHKKTISFCAKAQEGQILDEGTIPARLTDLSAWAERRGRPWWGAMEATLFTGWVYDHLKPLAQELKVAHPGDAQGDHRIQEEERQSGCAQDRRSAAL